MAIYSCNLASVGRTTHAAGTAGAHLRYIARPDAEPVMDAHAIPLDPVQARTWMDRQEAADRKNARVLDKLRIALPRELSEEQRLALAREFCSGITGGRVPWMFAIHQAGKDAHNPHAHIVIRDRDLESGKRVLRLSDSPRDREAAGLEPKAVEWIRARWEHHANQALERAGHDARIDRRSLDAQGIEREPTIHIGPRAQHIEGEVQRPQSRPRKDGRGRTIDYPAIDQGRTRKERHGQIIDLNLERDARAPDLETRAWAVFERTQRAADAQLESQLIEQARRRTAEERRVRAHYRAQRREIDHQRREEYQGAAALQRETLASHTAALRARQDEERQSLQRKQGKFWNRLSAVVDVTGWTRRRQAEARSALSSVHRGERASLAGETREARLALKQATDERYAPRREEVVGSEAKTQLALKEAHSRAEAAAEAKRQVREAEREQERRQTAQAIRAAKALEQGPEPETRRQVTAAQAREASPDQVKSTFDAAARGNADDVKARRLDEIRQRLRQDRQRDRGPSHER